MSAGVARQGVPNLCALFIPYTALRLRHTENNSKKDIFKCAQIRWQGAKGQIAGLPGKVLCAPHFWHGAHKTEPGPGLCHVAQPPATLRTKKSKSWVALSERLPYYKSRAARPQPACSKFGRIAQGESASLTRKRSEVQIFLRPPQSRSSEALSLSCFCLGPN